MVMVKSMNTLHIDNVNNVWGDLDGDGEEECLKCGKIKDEDAEQVG